ncbi:MAG: tRNA pseudouridine(55) synthase TruB [Actinomycetota bacterium]|nr:tRNA pseudouridine(55) synthase TruB [Actinomycetota bacterium]MDQ3498759.1 tRNA pseudouridine(55) synthase TruB [Actinomycetota bacterium]
MTSARAVSGVKRLLEKKTRIGHTGTLDPLASGLLVLLIGRATRLSRYVTNLDKAYTATARFGAVSDTLDAEGEITDLDAPPPSEDAIRDALPTFTGDLFQVPPMTSALKREGVRLYDLHRRGISVEREARPVTVHSLGLAGLDSAEQTATFEISCSSGTYVRTLLSDLARFLGSGAYLTALRRTSVGHLSVRDACTIPDLTPDTLHNHIIPPLEVVTHLPGVEVPVEVGRGVVCHGRRIGRCRVHGSYRVMCGGEMLAVYRDDEDGGRAEVVLCAE